MTLQGTYPDTTFLMHSYRSSSSHMPSNQWQLQTHTKGCIQLDGSQACSVIYRPQLEQTTTNLQNSEYSCSVNFSDRIVTLDLSLQHPFSNLELVSGTCTFTFWGVLAPWRSCLYQGSPHVELVGGTSSLTDVGVPRILGASCEGSCNDPWHGKPLISHHSMYIPITNQFI
jgi:hypothetical protein